MLTVSRADIDNNGGLLSAISQKSEDFIRQLINKSGVKDRADTKYKYLNRIILHADPHIDEYFAQLLFRAILPESVGGSTLDFQEVSITSKEDDLNCQNLFPSSAVFGIGREYSGGAEALFIFDEHQGAVERTDATASCSQLVANKYLKKIPQPIYTVLREVNSIDRYGRANPNNLANIIKQLWNSKFTISDDDTWCIPSPKWKRSIVEACLTSIIYCLENNIDIFGHHTDQLTIFKKYADFSLQRSHYKDDIYFNKFDIKKSLNPRIFRENNAQLRNKDGGFILNKKSKEIPQLLMIQRICYACHNCWGENTTKIIMLHIFDLLVKGSIHFHAVQNDLGLAMKNNEDSFRMNSGFIERRTLPKITTRSQNNKIISHELIVLHFSPLGFESQLEAKKAAQNYINKFFDGCGILLMENTTNLTKALFAGKNISKHKGWGKVVNNILLKEPDAWYQNSPDFILNGNKAHLYHPRSKLDIDSLETLVKENFY